IVGNKNALLAETNGTTEILMGPAEVNPRLAVDPGRIRQFQVTATGVYMVTTSSLSLYTFGSPGEYTIIADTTVPVDGFTFTGFGISVTSIAGERFFADDAGTLFFVASEATTSGVYQYDGVSVSAVLRLDDVITEGTLTALRVAFDRETGGIFAVGATDTPSESVYSVDPVGGPTAIANVNTTPTDRDPASFRELFARDGTIALAGSTWVEDMPGGPIDAVPSAYRITKGGSLDLLALGGETVGGFEFRSPGIPLVTVIGLVAFHSGSGVPPGMSNEVEVYYVENLGGTLDAPHYEGGSVGDGLTWTSLFIATPRIFGGLYIDGFVTDGVDTFGVLVADDDTGATVVGSAGTPVTVNGMPAEVTRPLLGISAFTPDIQCWNTVANVSGAFGVECEGTTESNIVDIEVDLTRGSDSLFTVSLTNNGGLALDGYSIEIMSSPAVGYVFTDSRCTASSEAGAALCIPGLDEGSLFLNDTVSFTFSVTNAPTNTDVTLTAEATGTVGQTTDTQSDTLTFNSSAGADLSLVVTPNNSCTSEQICGTLSNDGPDPATDIQLTAECVQQPSPCNGRFVIPSGALPISAAGAITGELAVGQSVDVVWTFEAGSRPGDEVRISVGTMSSIDPDLSNNSIMGRVSPGTGGGCNAGAAAPASFPVWLLAVALGIAELRRRRLRSADC
ncbi:MAG: hypothetical protein AAF654_15265, partial [Myxococcota bacterium]